MRNISDKIYKKSKKHFMFIFFIVPLMSYVEKYCRARQATDDIKVAQQVCNLHAV